VRNVSQPSEELFLFEEQSPFQVSNARPEFKSECPPDKKIKVENLFEFKRGRGDLQISIAAFLIAMFFFVFFWTQTGWENRKLPDDLGSYIAYQFGFTDIEGRVMRFGRILKESWVAPMLCLLILVPAAILNLRSSLTVHKWRKRFQQPTSGAYEFSKYIAALEFAVYFIGYTFIVPILGYLFSTLLLGSFLTWRLGYRTMRWTAIGLLTSFTIVVLFRTILQIKTPISIWLYDQLPEAVRIFMLTYF
jgi:hypothetical protein